MRIVIDRRLRSARLRDQRGAAAVITALLLVVFIGLMALAIDGGVLWVKYRRARNANDAAALAAALSCARNEGLTVANAQADSVARANMSDAAQTQANSYPSGCQPSAGTVTVRYGGNQSLSFAPVVGMSSPKPVVAQATAVWGPPGAAGNVVPLTISAGALSTCDIPNGTPPRRCLFWWDSDLTSQATWAILNLSTWDYSAGQGGCSPDGSNLNDAVTSGWPSPLSLDPNPKYPCAVMGAHTNVSNQINKLGKDNGWPLTFLFPVNDPTKQVASDGSVCAYTNPDCDVYQYAIIGFAEMQVQRDIENGPAAVDMCNPPVPPKSPGNFFCMEAVWTGWNSTGYEPGGGSTNFGTIAISLKQ